MSTAASAEVKQVVHALAGELDVQAAIHLALASPSTPYRCSPRFRSALGNPLELEAVLVKHPKLRVLVTHAGYPYLEETEVLMSVYPQVYVDLARSTCP